MIDVNKRCKRNDIKRVRWKAGEKGQRSSGSLPGELCSTGTSTAQGRQQQFECIGGSLSSFVSFTASTSVPLLLLSLYLSAWPSMFICLKTATIKYPQSTLPSPLLAAGVTALLEVQNSSTGVQRK